MYNKSIADPLKDITRSYQSLQKQLENACSIPKAATNFSLVGGARTAKNLVRGARTAKKTQLAVVSNKIDGIFKPLPGMSNKIIDDIFKPSAIIKNSSLAEVARVSKKTQLAVVSNKIDNIFKPLSGMSNKIDVLFKPSRAYQVSEGFESIFNTSEIMTSISKQISDHLRNPILEVSAKSILSISPSLNFPNSIIPRPTDNSIWRPIVPEERRVPSPETDSTTFIDEVNEEISPETIPAPSPDLYPITNHEKVFIVHGRDHATRDIVAEFVNNWGLRSTILDKQPNKGRTIIEKFKQCADEASFAIVLLTPDDVGGLASTKYLDDLKPRARQNVILELGYFLKALEGQQICILYKGDVELPSDLQGLLYIPMDDTGEWRQKLIREMLEAKILIDKNKA